MRSLAHITTEVGGIVGCQEWCLLYSDCHSYSVSYDGTNCTLHKEGMLSGEKYMYNLTGDSEWDTFILGGWDSPS